MPGGVLQLVRVGALNFSSLSSRDYHRMGTWTFCNCHDRWSGDPHPSYCRIYSCVRLTSCTEFSSKLNLLPGFSRQQINRQRWFGPISFWVPPPWRCGFTNRCWLLLTFNLKTFLLLLLIPFHCLARLGKSRSLRSELFWCWRRMLWRR